MKKIVRLSENDLTRIVKRVLNEEEFKDPETGAPFKIVELNELSRLKIKNGPSWNIFFPPKLDGSSQPAVSFLLLRQTDGRAVGVKLPNNPTTYGDVE